MLLNIKLSIRLITLILLSGLLCACASEPKVNVVHFNPGQPNLQVKQVDPSFGGRNYILCQKCVNYSLADVSSAFPQQNLLSNK